MDEAWRVLPHKTRSGESVRKCHQKMAQGNVSLRACVWVCGLLAAFLPVHGKHRGVSTFQLLLLVRVRHTKTNPCQMPSGNWTPGFGAYSRPKGWWKVIAVELCVSPRDHSSEAPSCGVSGTARSLLQWHIFPALWSTVTAPTTLKASTGSNEPQTRNTQLKNEKSPSLR